jgi:arylsulfatase A-like enzyme
MRILYLDIDTFRPDHMSCYGYHRQTTPNLDRIAGDGVRFNRFYCPDSPCQPSRAALFSGQLGINTGVINHGGINADRRPQGHSRGFRSRPAMNSLGQKIRDAGYYTVSISPFGHRHSYYEVFNGFRETYDTGRGGIDDAHEVFPYAERWLRNRGKEDQWFLHINMWDPHTPYDTPAAHGEPFKDSPPPAWLTDELIQRHRASYSPHDAVTPHGRYDGTFNWTQGAPTIANQADWKKWIDGYDNGIHYADHYVGKMITLLKELGIYEETAILVSSDHGENHGELCVYGDHQTADEITHRIPMIVRWPGITDGQKGKAFDGFHYNVDLAATLVDVLGGKIPEEWDGRSFAETLRTGRDAGHEFLVLSNGAWSCQRGVRWGDWLLLRTYHTGLKEYPSLMLFNLKDDPHETRNLAAKRPDVVNEGLRRLESFITENLIKSGQPDPIFQVIADGGPLHTRDGVAPMAKLLRATGREKHADWLEKHGGAPREDSGLLLS